MQVKWAEYHSKFSSGSKKDGWLRYLLDIWDIHPKRLLDQFKANEFSRKNGDRKIGVFVHIPKTGGSYVTRNFPKNGFFTLNHSLIRNILTDEYVPVGLVGTKFKSRKNYFLFSTVRSPVTFLRSYFHHVAGHGNHTNIFHYDYENAEKGFDYFVRAILDRDDKWPSKNFLYPQLFDQSGDLAVDWINKNETLDSDIKVMSDYLGYQFTQSEKIREAPKQELSHYYSDTLMDMVLTCYSREMALFGYNQTAEQTQPILHLDVSESNVKYDYANDELSLAVGNIIV